MLCIIENFADGLKLRGGVYFVDSIPKTPTGKFVRKQATEIATKLFETAKNTDKDVRQYLLDIPENFRKII